MRKMISMCLFVMAATAACGKGGSDIGVPECDSYLTQMRACGSKKGGDTGTQLNSMADMMQKAWSADKDNPNAKPYMAETCTSAIKDMKAKVPDCDWK
jgi:hypothetical protein